MKRKTPVDVDDYIDRFPKQVRLRLETMRSTIRRAAPGAVETISYGMPAFRQNRVLVWFAAFEHHIGFYPGASGIAAFKNDLSSYKSAKGSVQFPLDKPLPLALVTRIVKFRVVESQRQKKTRR